MISRVSLDDRVREWGLREDIVEKDYVLGWLLWGIGSEPALRERWVFKGGTCLKKCYIETYRFSEDLDFTVLNDGPLAPDDVLPPLRRMLDHVNQTSGIEFAVQPPRLRLRPNGNASEGRVYYIGPRAAPGPASIKLDLDGEEPLLRETEWRPIAHPYDDTLPEPATVQCYPFLEVFAEKLRAMGERGRPRDLYDIVNLFRRPDLRPDPADLRTLLSEKCNHKGCSIPTLATLQAAETRAELEAEWENMLAHQLLQLPPFTTFWNELENLFAWLEGVREPAVLGSAPVRAAGLTTWTPPPTIGIWGTAPVEPLRFAAQNRLLVEFDYVDEAGRFSHRRVEPYSLKQTSEGNIILGAFDLDRGAPRSFRVDRIRNPVVSNQAFEPRFALEIGTATFSFAPPRASRPSRTRRPRSARAPRHVIQCPVCGKRFYRKTSDTRLRKHKAPGGWNCSGRSGIYQGMR
jgi:predicted nucleotidyltransferase component of viral defense system